MNAAQTEEYLKMLLDLHQTMYIQQKVYSSLKNKANSLGNKKRIKQPDIENIKNNQSSITDTSIPLGIIIAIISAIILCFVLKSRPGFFSFLGFAIQNIIYGAIIGFVAFIVISIILAIIKNISSNDAYDKEMKVYENEIKKDNLRVKKELSLKKRVDNEATLLADRYYSTKATLDKLGSYHIIDNTYMNDMVAIASFYQYFKTGRTYSLGFDRETGDRGAYNIYEEELRLNTIIGKLDEIIDRLDSISNNQRELYRCISQANQKISSLSSSVNTLNNSVKEQTEIQKFNAECMQRELEYTNLVATMCLIK